MDRRFLLLLMLLFSLANECRCRHGKTRSGPRASRECNYRYEVQPWQNPVLSQCSPLGTTIQLTCIVRGTDDQFGVTWHRTSESQPTGIGTSVPQWSIRSEDRHFSEGQTTNFTATIRNFTSSDYGYYWCMVASNSNEYHPTPSRIILISERCRPYNTQQCNSPLELYSTTEEGEHSCADVETPGEPALPSFVECAPTPTTPKIPKSEMFSGELSNRSSLTHVSHSVLITPSSSEVPGTHSRNPTATSRPESQSDSGDDRGIERYTWFFIGGSAAILLVIIAILVAVILYIECQRRRMAAHVHGAVVDANIESAQAGPTENARDSGTKEEGQHGSRDKGVTSGRHDYTEIPNFLEECGTVTTYENVTGDSINASMRPGCYDDVLPDLARSGRRHSYDRVIDNDAPGYHRLHHTGSVHSQASQQSSLKLEASRQSSSAESESSAKLPETSRDHHRINIYKEETGSHSSQEDYHHLDRQSSTQPILASSKPFSVVTVEDEAEISRESQYSQLDHLDKQTSTQPILTRSKPSEFTARDETEISRESQYSQLDHFDKPTSAQSIGARSSEFTAQDETEVPQESQYSQLDHKVPHAVPPVSLKPLEDEQQLPEVRQYQSLYIGLSRDQAHQLSRSTQGSGLEGSHSNNEDEGLRENPQTQQTTFESLYSPPLEFGVTVAHHEEDETETTGSTLQVGHSLAEAVGSWLNPKASEGDRDSTMTTTEESPHSSHELAARSHDTGTVSDSVSHYSNLDSYETTKEACLSASRLGTASPDAHTPQTTDGAYSHLELECPAHMYTPVIPGERNTTGVYNVPIVSTPDMYKSERGHVYHLLETPSDSHTV